MSRKKERIDMDGGDGLSLGSAFDGLVSEGLPARADPPPEAPARKRVRAKGPKETLNLRRLKAGKGGKVVTEVSGFVAAPEQIRELLKRLQGKMGTGGALKGKVLELQGECRDRVKPLLEQEGYRVKGI